MFMRVQGKIKWTNNTNYPVKCHPIISYFDELNLEKSFPSPFYLPRIWPGISFSSLCPLYILPSLVTLVFMVSSFPLNKSHAPIPPLDRSQRCCGMSPWPFGYTVRGGSQPWFLARVLLVPFLSYLTHREPLSRFPVNITGSTIFIM